VQCWGYVLQVRVWVRVCVSDMCVHAATAPCAVLGACAAGVCLSGERMHDRVYRHVLAQE